MTTPTAPISATPPIVIPISAVPPTTVSAACPLPSAAAATTAPAASSSSSAAAAVGGGAVPSAMRGGGRPRLPRSSIPIPDDDDDPLLENELYDIHKLCPKVMQLYEKRNGFGMQDLRLMDQFLMMSETCVELKDMVLMQLIAKTLLCAMEICSVFDIRKQYLTCLNRLMKMCRSYQEMEKEKCPEFWKILGIYTEQLELRYHNNQWNVEVQLSKGVWHLLREEYSDAFGYFKTIERMMGIVSTSPNKWMASRVDAALSKYYEWQQQKLDAEKYLQKMKDRLNDQPNWLTIVWDHVMSKNTPLKKPHALKNKCTCVSTSAAKCPYCIQKQLSLDAKLADGFDVSSDSLSATGFRSHKPQEVKHHFIVCERCGVSPICGKRYLCYVCGTDMCHECLKAGEHLQDHTLEIIQISEFNEDGSMALTTERDPNNGRLLSEKYGSITRR